MKKQNKKRELVFSLVIFGILLNINVIFAALPSFGGAIPSSFSADNYRVWGASINPQFTQPSFSGSYGADIRNYWSDFNKEDCKQRQDVVLMIPPGGCSPSVVRSDLLEERDVPVFCKVSSIQVNPLIDVSRIRSIHFKGQFPRGVSGVSYYPARAAVRSARGLEPSPIIDNVGYLVVKLSRQEVESEMPDFLEGNVTAVIDYDAEGVSGVGEHDFYLTEMNDDEWERSYKEFGFWKGKGFIRLDSVDEESARISIYRDSNLRESTVNLKKGETSGDIYLGGYYCAAGMNLKLEDVDYPVDTALLTVDDEEIWVSKGSRFLDGECRVKGVEPGSVGGGVAELSCSGTGNIRLMLGGAPATLEVENSLGNKKKIDEYMSGELVTSKNGKDVYLVYSSKYSKAKSNYVVLVSMPEGEQQFGGMSAFIHKKQRVYEDYGGLIERGQALKKSWQLFVPGLNFYYITKEIADSLSSEEQNFYKYILGSINSKYPELKENIRILVGSGDKWDDYGITFKNLISGEQLLGEEQDLKEYYGLSVENYNEVFELYPGETKDNNKNLEPYAVQALENAAELSGKLGLRAKQIGYLEKLIENYPDSNLSRYAENRLELIYKTSVSKESQAVVYINNEVHFISLIDFKKPGYDDLGAELVFTVDGKIQEPVEWEKDSLEQIPGKNIPIEIEDITEDSIRISYSADFSFWTDLGKDAAWKVITGKEYKEEKKDLELGKEILLGKGITVRVNKINLNKQAKVKIIPKNFGMRTESDLSFKIGIEKRAIKLSPEKTQEMIDNLDESIEEWENINSKLEKVVMGLKGACFATSAMLTVSNLINGRTGKSMARNEVMTSAGGWNEKCRVAFVNQQDICGKGIPSSVSNCLLDCNSEIEASVEKLAGIYEAENKKMKEMQNIEGVTVKGTDILGLEDQIDSNKLKKAYCDEVFKNVDLSGEIDLKGKGSVPLVGETGIYSQLQIDKCDIDLEEMKLLKLREEVRDDSMLKDIVDKKLGSDLVYTYDINEFGRAENILENDVPGVPSYRDDTKSHYQPMVDVSEVKNSKFNSSVKKVMRARINGQSVIIGLVPVGGREYRAEQAFDTNGNKFEWEKDDSETSDVIEKYKIEKYFESKGITQFTEANTALYNNEFEEKPVVKYYERAPYTGLPAQVPIGKVGQTDGWYVGTDYVLSGFGKPYQESGRAMNFWICNVGSNGLVEFKQGDECRYYNLGSSADLNFPGLSKSESAKLVNEAQKAITEASRQHGKNRVSIRGQVFETDIAENGENGKCSDFMSPQDCNLMFNVCDPVMCPESRCDYGGEYRVSNVVQSGIIGSLLLCLPNAQEGIAVPICLSGVHAGLEGYLSILRSTQDCLQENLDTGRNIGICDEIKSVYMCDFFWRQAAPLLDVFIPRIFSAFSGQGVRGGGEYLTVNYAWDNVKKSIDYFKDEYAVNAMKSFNDRSTAEIGGEVCKSFVSTRYPNSKDFFENLVEPDVPAQYHAWFSEDILTEATIPSTSHYKVYYHIYAGKDIGANYVVYLKNPPESSYVHTLGTYVVDRGYIQMGQQVDKARDFTGVSGYQELCVNINGQEECGFKQVSTSWAINELSRRYAAEQAAEGDIKTSQECVSGEQSLWSFAQPNLQSGAQEALNPELYKRGIIRVCSSDNPGKQVQSDGSLDTTNSTYDRWKKVGDCDESAGIGCWIDTNSVENVLRDAPNLTDKVLDEIDVSYLGDVEIMDFKSAGDILEKADEFKLELSTANLKKENIEGEIGGLVLGLIAITERGPSNPYKANAFFLMGKIYDGISVRIYNERVLGVKDTSGSEKEGLTTTREEDLMEGVLIEGEISISSGGGGTGGGGPIKINCKYKYENKNWIIEPSNQERCKDVGVSGKSYFQGIGKIAEKYNEIKVGGTPLSGNNLYEQIINVLRGMAEGKSSSDSRTKWTLDSAIEEIKTRNGKYSGNKVFIDQLYEDDLLNGEEYDDINGFWNLYEEDMKYVGDILSEKKKKIEWENKSQGDEEIIKKTNNFYEYRKEDKFSLVFKFDIKEGKWRYNTIRTDIEQYETLKENWEKWYFTGDKEDVLKIAGIENFPHNDFEKGLELLLE